MGPQRRVQCGTTMPPRSEPAGCFVGADEFRESVCDGRLAPQRGGRLSRRWIGPNRPSSLGSGRALMRAIAAPDSPSKKTFEIRVGLWRRISFTKTRGFDVSGTYRGRKGSPRWSGFFTVPRPLLYGGETSGDCLVPMLYGGETISSRRCWPGPRREGTCRDRSPPEPRLLGRRWRSGSGPLPAMRPPG
jgi:hypothetical protein